MAGPTRIPGMNGGLYYQVVIDDFSHFWCIYLLKYKSEATYNLTDYIRRFETVNGVKLNKVWCDNAEEFKTHYLNRTRHKDWDTQPYSPQQNRVSERMNKTLHSRARTLLLEIQLPRYLWGEGIACVLANTLVLAIKLLTSKLQTIQWEVKQFF